MKPTSPGRERAILAAKVLGLLAAVALPVGLLAAATLNVGANNETWDGRPSAAPTSTTSPTYLPTVPLASVLGTTVVAPTSTPPSTVGQPNTPGYADPGYTAPGYPDTGAPAPAPYTPAPTTPAPVVTAPRTTSPPATVATTSPAAPTTKTFTLGVTASYFQDCDYQQGMKALPYLVSSSSGERWVSTYRSCDFPGGFPVYFYKFSGVP
jgi:hypothetical protein